MNSTHQLTTKALPLKRLAATICALAFTEWLLFELLRAPYRPPQDMTTFLGTEKYSIMAFMVMLAAGGCILIARWAVRSGWTRRDVSLIVLLLIVLMGTGIYVVIHPAWPVTPLNWVLK